MEQNSYVEIFWDYGEIRDRARELSRESFRDWIQETSKKSEIMHKLILRRFIERARFDDLFYFFEPSQVEKALNEFKSLKISPVRLHALRYSIKLLSSKNQRKSD